MTWRHIEYLFGAKERNPSQLNITMWDASTGLEQNRRFFDAGVDYIVHILTTRDDRSTQEALELVAEAVL